MMHEHSKSVDSGCTRADLAAFEVKKCQHHDLLGDCPIQLRSLQLVLVELPYTALVPSAQLCPMSALTLDIAPTVATPATLQPSTPAPLSRTSPRPVPSPISLHTALQHALFNSLNLKTSQIVHQFTFIHFLTTSFPTCSHHLYLQHHLHDREAQSQTFLTTS